MPNEKFVEITECPRDAMQGWHAQISTLKKIEYLQSLLEVGFQTLDFGSFVSPKSIPQMADTKDVVIELHNSQATSLLAIVANLRGATDAVKFDSIEKLGFPFSLSETFQLRNTNSSIDSAFDTVQEMQELCIKNNKTLIVYLSMGFGNPYGDAYSKKLVLDWIEKFIEINILNLSIADTVGIATPDEVNNLLKDVINNYPQLRLGTHLHAERSSMTEKIDAALDAGCTRFDSAIKGIGGCPMAGNALVGNIDTEILVNHLLQKGYATSIDIRRLEASSKIAADIFI